MIPDIQALGEESIDLATDELRKRSGLGDGSAAPKDRRALDSSRASSTPSTSVDVVLTSRRRVPRRGVAKTTRRNSRGSPTNSAQAPGASPTRPPWPRELAKLCGVSSSDHHTGEACAVNRIENADPIGLIETTKFLAEERILGSCLGQRLPKQMLDGAVGFSDQCAVSVAEAPDSK